jgi:cyanophycin synthetase
VSLIEGKLALLEGTTQHVLCSLEALGITKLATDTTQTYNVMAAAAAAWALGLTPDLIQAGLLSFDPNTAVPQ